MLGGVGLTGKLYALAFAIFHLIQLWWDRFKVPAEICGYAINELPSLIFKVVLMTGCFFQLVLIAINAIYASLRLFIFLQQYFRKKQLNDYWGLIQSKVVSFINSTRVCSFFYKLFEIFANKLMRSFIFLKLYKNLVVVSSYFRGIFKVDLKVEPDIGAAGEFLGDCIWAELSSKFFSKTFVVQFVQRVKNRGLVMCIGPYEFPIGKFRVGFSIITGFLMYLDPSGIDMPEDPIHYYWWFTQRGFMANARRISEGQAPMFPVKAEWEWRRQISRYEYYYQSLLHTKHWDFVMEEIPDRTKKDSNRQLAWECLGLAVTVCVIFFFFSMWIFTDPSSSPFSFFQGPGSDTGGDDTGGGGGG